jgi:2,7-dihydroxy-5-methyl-1-naphthoate 7-O-methyltransferase
LEQSEFSARKRSLADGNEVPEPEGLPTLLGLMSMAEPWAVRVAATLFLADLVSEEGTRLEHLAAQSGTDQEALGRLLRFLAARGVFAERCPGLFALTEAARLLRQDHPVGLRSWLDLTGAGGVIDRAYAGLLETVRTGEPAYSKLSGRSLWEDLNSDPSLAASFAGIMSTPTSQIISEVTVDYPWSGVDLVVDVGGGNGALLASILRAHPDLHGILLDSLATSSAAPQVMRRDGLAERCAIIDGDFFAPLPANADVYMLKNVIHNWPDNKAEIIIRRCAEATGPGGRILIIEFVSGMKGNECAITGMDLRMLVLHGGRERTLAEFNALASAAGMRLLTVRQTRSGYSLIEYVHA